MIEVLNLGKEDVILKNYKILKEEKTTKQTTQKDNQRKKNQKQNTVPTGCKS